MRDTEPDLTLLPKGYKLAVGDTVAEAWLYIPPENPKVGQSQIVASLYAKAQEASVALGQIEFEDTTPDDQRIPADTVKEWPLGTRVLIGSCKVIGNAVLIADNEDKRGMEFLAELPPDDLQLLRRLTRLVARRFHKHLTDAECDAVIAERGPQINELMIAHAAGGGGE